jgi:hypothetical protein
MDPEDGQPAALAHDADDRVLDVYASAPSGRQVASERPR